MTYIDEYALVGYEEEGKDECYEDPLNDTYVFQKQWNKKKRKYQAALKNEGEVLYFRNDNFMQECGGTNSPVSKLRFMTIDGRKIKAKMFTYAVYKSAAKYFKAIYPEYKQVFPKPEWVAHSARTIETNNIVIGKSQEGDIYLEIKPLETYLSPSTRQVGWGDSYYTGQVYLKWDVDHEVIFTSEPVVSIVAERVYYEVEWIDIEKGEIPAVPIERPEWWREGFHDYIGFDSIEAVIKDREYWARKNA
jgi:hypothetical protein